MKTAAKENANGSLLGLHRPTRQVRQAQSSPAHIGENVVKHKPAPKAGRRRRRKINTSLEKTNENPNL